MLPLAPFPPSTACSFHPVRLCRARQLKDSTTQTTGAGEQGRRGWGAGREGWLPCLSNRWAEMQRSFWARPSPCLMPASAAGQSTGAPGGVSGLTVAAVDPIRRAHRDGGMGGGGHPARPPACLSCLGSQSGSTHAHPHSPQALHSSPLNPPPCSGYALSTGFQAATGATASTGVASSSTSGSQGAAIVTGSQGRSTDGGQAASLSAAGTFATPHTAGAGGLTAAGVTGRGSAYGYGVGVWASGRGGRRFVTQGGSKAYSPVSRCL